MTLQAKAAAKNKMDFAEFIASMPHNGTSQHWRNVLPIMFEEDDFRHNGDCTGVSCSCNLCLIERLLSEYREYIFEEAQND